MKERGEMYGTSWRDVKRLTSFLDYIDMKLSRAYSLAMKEDISTTDIERIHDQLLDTINYCLFAILKLNEVKPNETSNNTTNETINSYGEWGHTDGVAYLS